MKKTVIQLQDGYSQYETQWFKLDSKNTSSSYEINVSLPSSHGWPDYNDFPLIIILDGQWNFPLLHSMENAVNYDGDIPEAIIVGISLWDWANIGKRQQNDAKRAQEFVPTKCDSVSNSLCGAKQFKKFLKNELIPLLETNFKIGKDRILMGASLSALFAMYTYLTENNLFSAYIASSPPLFWSHDEIKLYLDNNPVRAAKMYFSKGEFELGDLDALYELLRLGEKTLYEKIPNSGHASANIISFLNGMRYVFKKPNVELSVEQLNFYCGTYKDCETQNQVLLLLHEAKLWIVLARNKILMLSSAGGHSFYSNGVSLTIEFNLNSQGCVESLTKTEIYEKTFFKKVNPDEGTTKEGH